MSRTSGTACAFLGRRGRGAGGDLRHRLRCRLKDARALPVHPSSPGNTGPESTVFAAASGGGGGRLRRPGAAAGEGRA
jgi:hypothetical protein